MIRRAVLFMALATAVVLLVSGVASAATCEINGGAKYTNSTSVAVSYSPGVFDEVFQISNDDNFAWLDDWQPVDIRPYVNWTLSGWMGKRTVYMEFASDPDNMFPSHCQDSIILDQSAPSISALSVTVKRGRVCYLPIIMLDTTSPRCQDTVRITTRSGVVKKKFVDIFQRTGRWWYWRYRCNLPVGNYRIKVSCVDLAGNVADYRTGAWLRVR